MQTTIGWLSKGKRRKNQIPNKKKCKIEEKKTKTHTTKKKKQTALTHMDIPIIDLGDALMYVQQQGYTCAKLAEGNSYSMLTALSLDVISPSLAWLCLAGAIFFAVRLGLQVIHMRRNSSSLYAKRK